MVWVVVMLAVQVVLVVVQVILDIRGVQVQIIQDLHNKVSLAVLVHLAPVAVQVVVVAVEQVAQVMLELEDQHRGPLAEHKVV